MFGKKHFGELEALAQTHLHCQTNGSHHEKGVGEWWGALVCQLACTFPAFDLPFAPQDSLQVELLEVVDEWPQAADHRPLQGRYAGQHARAWRTDGTVRWIKKEGGKKKAIRPSGCDWGAAH